MAAPASIVRAMLACTGGALLGFCALALIALWPLPEPATAQRPGDPLAKLKATFARPTFVPAPADNPQTPAKIALGKRLFADPELSDTATIACTSCHDPKLAFTDGEATGKGVTGKRLARHTPSLWNVAWAPLLRWDGRAASLEQQVLLPIEHPDEMGTKFGAVVERLARHASYEQAFAAAFPDNPQISEQNVARALAAFERTLVSPPTRFDKWVAGDAAALTASEQNGFAIFTGRGRCINCHTGFAFTDHGFYDIGLPDEDLGRGPVMGLAAVNQAFKVPTLRELAWTAPYMHDGSLGTLDDVVRVYEMGGVDRPTRSKDLPRNMRLTDQERADLVAFLESLSSDAPPRPSTEAWLGAPPAPRSPPPGAPTAVVSQSNKLFTPQRVRLKVGQALTVLNDDTRTHNVRIYHPKLDFNSGAQEPRETITLRFPAPGTFEAFCGIHPSMRLTVEVE
jgi:cytochrome c peroxidase